MLDKLPDRFSSKFHSGVLKATSKHALAPARSQHLARSKLITRSLHDLDRATASEPAADVEHVLDKLRTVKRQLDQAVLEEDYEQASKLKQYADSIKEQLPPVKQYMLGQTDRLKTGSIAQQQAAIKALAEVGDEYCTAELAACLRVPELHDLAEDALWATWYRHPNPEAKALMNQGLTMLRDNSRLQPALEVFDAACKMEPGWAEAHNKRATLLYLMHKYQESIDACKLVLDLNPYHFGALSGMGLCYIELRNYQEALRAFEQALSVNPDMESCKNYVLAIRAQLADEAGR